MDADESIQARETTLCFPLRGGGDGGSAEEGVDGEPDEVDDREALLIEKRRGLGEGWYNGPGGKLEPDETPRECAVRETREEVGLEVDPGALEKAGELTFVLDGAVHTRCHVFRTTSFSGQPRPSPEADPVWIPVGEVPYDRMWEDDRHWLPGVLEGRTVIGAFRFEGGRPLDEAAFVDYDLEWGVSFDDE
ncbi:8-oxo-dGTP diphosphatase [Natrialbaceae archaeon GCM10025810]|uniref:8-oxo-dGTP diphosphatase n=1 Tax=Halovalidus salilacus TaxID=3075124 RepID=UPI0036224A4F